MRRSVFFTMATFASAAVFGQSLLDCVDPDVLRTLLLREQIERSTVFTAAMPAELSTTKMPREFSWIGSAERISGPVAAQTNSTQVTAAWRSSLAPDAALAAASAALTASGWEVRPRLRGGDTGFVTSTMTPSTPACREGKPVNFTANIMNGVTYVLFMIQHGNGTSICNQPARFYTTGTGLDQYLPRLDMPTDPATGMAVRFQAGGYGGSSTSGMSAYIAFSTTDSIANIALYFTRQMAAQGWSTDASWSGAASAGSSWFRRVDAATLHGTLLVNAFDGGQFLATLRVSKLQ